MAKGIAIVSVAALLVSGCVGSAGGTKSAVEPEVASIDESTAGIQGVVTDDSFNPIANATVGILDRDAVASTNEGGRFALSRLEPGPVFLAVQALGYESVVRSIDLRAGEVTEVTLSLAALAIVEPYHVVVPKNGKIFCGVAWRTPVSALNTAFAACGAVYGTPLSGLDSFVVIFEITSKNISAVRTLVFETSWKRTQTFGSGLDILWENYQDVVAYTFTEPVRRFARMAGPSPLHAETDDDEIRSNVTKHKPPPRYCGPNGPCKYWARVFPYASTFGSSSAVDFAFYVDQTYNLYVTEFYGERPPPLYTAIKDG